MKLVKRARVGVVTYGLDGMIEEREEEKKERNFEGRNNFGRFYGVCLRLGASCLHNRTLATIIVASFWCFCSYSSLPFHHNVLI